jgi:4-amino-4-deoxy-L-arabinose transferase-like glycosyltransferase
LYSPVVNVVTPALVSQTAVRRLPRLALILFCVVYVLPGFLGREPWKVADVTAFGVMLEMAAGRSGWWAPQVLGIVVEEAGPLPYWLGAVFIKLMPFASPELAARVPFGLLLALTLVSTWYTVYHLARQPAAQPVSFAFGGEASPKDYARAVADAGLLALLACLGLAQLSHETTPDLARLAMVATLLYAATQLARPGARASGRTLSLWGGACAALVLSGAPWITVLLGTGWLLLAQLSSQRSAPPDSDWQVEPVERVRRVSPILLAWGLLALVMALAAWLGQVPPSQPWMQRSAMEWDSWGQLLVWFSWPAWPLALWTLWRWRRQLLSAHVALPLWSVLVGVADSALSADRDRALLLALPALAALAAFALPTLRRSVAALIDWFTLLFFTGCAVVIWVIWVAMQTGVPAQPAANVAKLAPGFQPSFSVGLFLVAALATLCWVWLVSWRVGRHREAIWKSLVLPAAGATLCWLLLMTLWLPLLDFARSYGPLSRSIAALVPARTCVLVDGLSQAQIAALQYHGQLDLQRTGANAAPACQTLVVSPATQPSLDQRVELTHWAFKATVFRLTDNKERLLIYQRVGG